MSRLKESALTLLKIRPGESSMLTLLALFAFFKSVSLIYFETAANTLFLSRFKIEVLPYVYIASAVVSVLTGLLYTYCEARLSALTMARGLIALLALMLGSFYLLS